MGLTDTRHPWVRQHVKRRAAGVLVLSTFIASILGCATNPAHVATPAGLPRNESRYLTMRDGARIATDVWYPADLAPGQQVPTIVRSTRYWRAEQMGWAYRLLVALGRTGPPGFEEAEVFNEAGYALVTVDARGSGASFGQRPIEFSPDEVADLGEVAEWIVSQPWSNGNIGTYGVSYDGNTAELAAVPGHPGVRAVAPQYSDFDPVFYLAMPGGVLNDGFIRAWNNGNQALDRNDLCGAAEATGFQCLLLKALVRGVKPVTPDPRGQTLAEALASHDTLDLYAALQTGTYRDDSIAENGVTAATVSPYALRDAIEGSGAAMYVWVSWMDAGTVDGALSRYLTFSNPQKVIIGAWSHGGFYDADPFHAPDARPDPPISEQRELLVEFFNTRLKEGASGMPERGIRYYTMNEGVWNETATWPPAGVAPRRWYFGRNGTLVLFPPTTPEGHDEYTVDLTATTGEHTRWHTQLGGDDVVYPDRAEEDGKLLTYTTEPMAADVEITGAPVLTLYVASTADDGAFHAYLEDVAPDGRVTYITEGILRALHRKVSDAEPPYVQVGPYHSYNRTDGMPLAPGEIAEIRFNLYTTSVLIRQGHRIRIALAGHDAAFFARYPAEGIPVLAIQRNAPYPSHIDLPVRER